MTTPADEGSARFSPNGKWIAYQSNIAGRTEAFIRAFPGGPPGEWPVSSGGAVNLAWDDQGKELFYSVPSPGAGGDLIATGIRFLPDRVEIGAPERLFTGSYVNSANVSRDAQRFLMFARPEIENDRNPLTVVLNWQAGLN
jgi:hypothetical protein